MTTVLNVTSNCLRGRLNYKSAGSQIWDYYKLDSSVSTSPINPLNEPLGRKLKGSEDKKAASEVSHITQIDLGAKTEMKINKTVIKALEIIARVDSVVMQCRKSKRIRSNLKPSCPSLKPWLPYLPCLPGSPCPPPCQCSYPPLCTLPPALECSRPYCQECGFIKSTSRVSLIVKLKFSPCWPHSSPPGPLLYLTPSRSACHSLCNLSAKKCECSKEEKQCTPMAKKKVPPCYEPIPPIPLQPCLPPSPPKLPPPCPPPCCPECPPPCPPPCPPLVSPSSPPPRSTPCPPLYRPPKPAPQSSPCPRPRKVC